MSAETAEVLRQARGLISDQAHWTQGVLARGTTGAPTEPWDDEQVTSWRRPVKFCARGAVYHIVGHEKHNQFEAEYCIACLAVAALNSAACAVSPWDLGSRLYSTIDKLNDYCTHAKVLEAFNVAILREEHSYA